jgi:hypothetical protein
LPLVLRPLRKTSIGQNPIRRGKGCGSAVRVPAGQRAGSSPASCNSISGSKPTAEANRKTSIELSISLLPDPVARSFHGHSRFSIASTPIRAATAEVSHPRKEPSSGRSADQSHRIPNRPHQRVPTALTVDARPLTSDCPRFGRAMPRRHFRYESHNVTRNIRKPDSEST